MLEVMMRSVSLYYLLAGCSKRGLQEQYGPAHARLAVSMLRKVAVLKITLLSQACGSVPCTGEVRLLLV